MEILVWRKSISYPHIINIQYPILENERENNEQNEVADIKTESH
jgi:hypothetical protein